jgi:division protein CdvB (Snf7/Vps24/ESCRT-III family)
MALCSEGIDLSERFAKKWETNRENKEFPTRIREAVRAEGPLKPRMDNAIRRLELQIQRLDQASERFNQKDRTLFAKVVDAYTKHDTAHANVYANELAEVRKVEKLTMNARLALDQVLLRVRTVSELGDVVSTLGPVIGVLGSIRTRLVGVIPDAENDIGEIANMLSGVMFDAGTSSGMTLSFNTMNEDATKILSEAATVAEQRINEKLPDLPPGIASGLQSGKTATKNP